MKTAPNSIFFKNASVLNEKTCPPGKKYPQYCGFNVIISGCAEYKFSSKEIYLLHPGDLIAIYPNHPFLLTGAAFHYQFVSFDGEGAEQFLAHIGLPPKDRAQKKLPTRVQTLMNQMIKGGIENITNPCFFWTRLFAIGDLVFQIRKHPARDTRPSYPERIELIAQQRDYQHLSVESIAAELNVSPDTLRKACLKEKHMPANSYLIHLKINRAKKLLETTPYKVAYIAALAGFGSEKHFFKSFKANVGKTPLTWRHSRKTIGSR